MSPNVAPIYLLKLKSILLSSLNRFKVVFWGQYEEGLGMWHPVNIFWTFSDF